MKLKLLLPLSLITLFSLGFGIWYYFNLQDKKKKEKLALIASFGVEKFFSEKTTDPTWLESRHELQKQLAKDSKVFRDFSYNDVVLRSGITFKHRVNPDCGKEWKPVHYDHGNGITVADVDLDGLLDIYFVSQAGNGELWKNQGNNTFINITKASGLEVTRKRVSASASFADIDNDGDPDLFVSTVNYENYLFENNGKGVFTDISKSSGVNSGSHSSGVTFFDFNNDGLLDIFIANVGQYTLDKVEQFKVGTELYEYHVGMEDGFAGHLKPERAELSILYKNLGGNKFEEVTLEVGLTDKGWSGDAIILDGNGDNYMDLYITNMQGKDHYYENQSGENFIDKTDEKFEKTPWGAMGISLLDFDNDGLEDLFVTDMHSDMSPDKLTPDYQGEKEKIEDYAPESYLLTSGRSLFGNAFFKQQAQGVFEEISDKVNAENWWPWGPSSGDLNADGFEDLFIASSMNYPFQYALNSVLLNDHGEKFIDSEFLLGVEPRMKPSIVWFTLDCDGEDSDHLFCTDKTGQLDVWSPRGSRSSVILDLDNDGDLDIVTNEFNDQPQVMISDLSEKNPNLHYLKVKLIGTTSNRDAIGAKVVIKANSGSTFTKTLTGKSGYLSQSSIPLYFGLGEADKVDQVMVIWPGGKKQHLDQPNIINDLLVITES